jgi:predicted negative regulator of RcsB-dependent stress response
MSGKIYDPDDSLQIDPGDEFPASEAASESQMQNLFDEHKGKLAIGVAATLGIMVFYNWWEKRLAKSDPEDYARIQRLKAVVRTDHPEESDEIDDPAMEYQNLPPHTGPAGNAAVR